MELLYLWINRSDNDCIVQQEFNFSPSYKFWVNDKKNPTIINGEETNSINFLTIDNINNITTIVGSNGTGKTTLLSYIANNNCYKKGFAKEGYEKQRTLEFEYQKSIYVFIDNKRIFLYYNLEIELEYRGLIKKENVYWNRGKDNETEQTIDFFSQLCNVRKQLIVYLSNNSFIPDGLSNYSISENTYNVNLHVKTINLIATNFYRNNFEKNG